MHWKSSMKLSKNVITYTLIIAVGLLIGYFLPRLPMLMTPDYQEGDYSAHFQNTKTKVLVYGTRGCSFCNKTRAWFADNKVDFSDIDVQKSAVAAARLAELGGEGVPVVIIGNRMIRGYQPEVFEKALQALVNTKVK